MLILSMILSRLSLIVHSQPLSVSRISLIMPPQPLFPSPLSLLLCNHTITQSHTHTHSLSLVLVVMMKSKELKTKISHAHSLILSQCALSASVPRVSLSSERLVYQGVDHLEKTPPSMLHYYVVMLMARDAAREVRVPMLVDLSTVSGVYRPGSGVLTVKARNTDSKRERHWQRSLYERLTESTSDVSARRNRGLMLAPRQEALLLQTAKIYLLVAEQMMYTDFNWTQPKKQGTDGSDAAEETDKVCHCALSASLPVIVSLCTLSRLVNCTNCHDAVLCTNSRAVLGSLHTHSHCSSFCFACVLELGSTYIPSSA